MSLNEKVAIVTGGSRGIGAGVAEKLAKEGATVIVNYANSKDAADSVVKKIKDSGGDALAIKADVSQKEEVNAMVKKTVEEFGNIDILVNNAGICPMTEWFDMTEELWDKVHSINMKGTFLCSHAVSKVMKESGKGGNIIAMSSISALVGGALQTHYCPTKAGMKSLMQSLAIALGPYGIRCNSVLPGCILTDINREQLETDDELREYFQERIPLNRVGKPDDIGGVVAFLCSEEAKYVNGAEILVDGGMFVNLQ